MSTSGDIMSTSGDTQYIEGISWCIWGSKVIKPFNLYWKPRCTEQPPRYSWYPPHASWYSSDVRNIPWCTHGIPPMYWTSPDVLMVFPDVLNTHYTGCYEAGTTSRVSETVLAVQEVRFSFTKAYNIDSFLIISSYEKLYRKQPVAFLITENILFEKSDPSFLKWSFLKAGLYYMV